MKKYIAEMLGSFALVFCGTGAVVVNQESGGAITHLGIAITFGLIVMAMIHTIGDISGAHMNPAVTIAFTIAGRFDLKNVVPYIASQVIGSILASALLHFLFPANSLLGATMPAGSVEQSLLLELVLSFLLMLVIMKVATGSREKGQFAGITIGATVLLEALFAGPISGASMNPARSFAPAVVSGHLEHYWIYVAGPISGMILAIPTWRFLNKMKTTAKSS
jgi:aquaporin NIP